MIIPRPIWPFLSALLAAQSLAANHVIVVSVDGLRPEAIETLGTAGAPTFARLRCEGAATHNARSDRDSTSTVPNHSGMVTGRSMSGPEGHNYTSNGNPAGAATYHNLKGSYVASVFDVAHDHGLSTAFYYSKSKLAIITQSYSTANGAPDLTGEDDGPGKIDAAVFNGDRTSDEITASFVADLVLEKFEFSFVHLVDPDRAGHGSRWQTPEYYAAVANVDSYLASIVATIEGDPTLNGNTVLIVTADHGGEGSAHTAADNVENYTIPFYVWGAGIAPGDELYTTSAASRRDPGGARIDLSAEDQPIRNSDCANLALSLLGLPSVPGSTINAAQDLSPAPLAPLAPEAFTCLVKRHGLDTLIDWPAISEGSGYAIEINTGAGWSVAPGKWPITRTCWIDPAPADDARIYRVKTTP